MLSKKAKTKTQLDEAIAEVHKQMASLTADDPAYSTMVDQLDKLYKIKDPQSKTKAEFKDWIPVIGTIGGILVIVTFEAYGHTMTSKALSFVRKV